MLAYAGDFRAAQVVEHVAKFRPRKRGEDPIHYLVSGVVKVIHKAVSEAGVKVTSKGDYGTSFLIALSGKLYLLQEDGSVIRSRNGYSSIGWGEAYALGALAALKSREDPKTCLEESLQIAANLCPQIRGPFHVASFR